jgi:hypothetical protein
MCEKKWRPDSLTWLLESDRKFRAVVYTVQSTFAVEMGNIVCVSSHCHLKNHRQVCVHKLGVYFLLRRKPRPHLCQPTATMLLKDENGGLYGLGVAYLDLQVTCH